MKYKKAQDILPKDLIDKLQEFIEGGYLYIPKKQENKKTWGENTKTKILLAKRNKEIFNDFNNGISIKELSNKYYLVDNSIRRIIRDCKKERDDIC